MYRFHAIGGLAIGLVALIAAVSAAVAMTASRTQPAGTALVQSSAQAPPTGSAARPTPSQADAESPSGSPADDTPDRDERPATRTSGAERGTPRAGASDGTGSSIAPSPKASVTPAGGASRGVEDSRSDDRDEDHELEPEDASGSDEGLRSDDDDGGDD